MINKFEDWLDEHFADTWLENLYYWFWRMWNKIADIPKEIKWFYQRAKRGWSDRDAWGMYEYIAELNIGMLQHLKQNHCGYPSELTEKQWEKELQKMIDGFIAIRDIDNWMEDNLLLPNGTWDKKKYMSYHKKLNKLFRAGMKSYTNYFFHLWD